MDTQTKTSTVLRPDQVGLAYWAAASWGAAIGLSKDDADTLADLPAAAATWTSKSEVTAPVVAIGSQLLAGALMAIYAAIVVLVPLLLPVAQSNGVDPVHFGIMFLAAMEMGFLCPPAGMNICFSSAMFGEPIRYVAVSVLPALLAILLGTLAIALWPALSTWPPSLVVGHAATPAHPATRRASTEPDAEPLRPCCAGRRRRRSRRRSCPTQRHRPGTPPPAPLRQCPPAGGRARA